MKKLFLSLLITGLLSGAAFADMFDNLSDLSPVQKEQLTRVYETYKIKNNEIDTKIMEYSDKLNKIKASTDKSSEQIALLSSAYERNIVVLNAQAKQLKENLDAAYKQILTDNQFKEYSAQQLQVENAFSDFLRK